MTTLVTGITGFIGSEYFKIIAEDTKEVYYLLVRSGKLGHWEKKVAQFDHVHIVAGDLLAPDVFTETQHDEESKCLSQKIDRIVHLAALYDLAAAYSKLYKANVVGTQNLLFFARQCGRLKEFFYASTIAVAGDYQGLYTEDDFDLGQNFPDYYGQTKFEAEKLVRGFSKTNPQVVTTIARFGIVIGHSKTGVMPRVDGPYFLLRELSRLKKFKQQISSLPFIAFPYEGTSEIPLVPVDFAAKVINGMDKISHSKNGEGNLRVVHVLADDLPTNERLMNDFLKKMDINVGVIPLGPVKALNPIVKLGLKALHLPQSLSDYMSSTQKISSHKLSHTLKKSIAIPQYGDFSDTILNYSLEHFNHD